jgi:ParB-like nuclease domain
VRQVRGRALVYIKDIWVGSGGLGAVRHVPQPDRIVEGVRSEPSVGKGAESIDRTRVALEPGGLGAGRRVPQPDRAVVGARSSRRSGSKHKAETGPEWPWTLAVLVPPVTPNSRILLVPELARRRPGSGHRAANKFEGLSNRAVSAPVVTSHSRIVSSLDPEASRPSGNRHRAVTQFVWPSSRTVSAPLVKSHSRIVLSLDPEASRPSGEAANGSRQIRNDMLPALKLESYLIDALGSHSRRLRKSDAAHIREIANSIGALGFNVPLLIGQDNMVIDGESRLAAARQLGLASVPCIRVSLVPNHMADPLKAPSNGLKQGGWKSIDWK